MASCFLAHLDVVIFGQFGQYFRMENRIREFRKAKGLTLEGLAEILHTGARTIQRLEVGERELTLGWLKKLAAALDTTPSELINTTQSDKSIKSAQKELLYKIIELAAKNARTHPKMPIPLIVSVVIAVYAEARAGAFPERGMSGEKLDHILSSETQKLINYELSKNT